ncbi:hypothetical protein DFH07DRAFT_304416 [Mycena maculata]|uniref:Uncharacterized protein n=1 Tax=Mycena maculata TaxID=230809 RepID=A0AAD7HHH7_9AGAR|nr:hypothetical protein DFH07DRAFT_304416 [Mycena maculata]
MSVIVDDHDGQVHYNPANGWFSGGESMEYMTTTKVSVAAGSTATFNFEGSFIAVYGTVGPGIAQASFMTFSIDQGSAASYDAPATPSAIHHQSLWSSRTLASNGPHTLLISQNSAGERIYLDYILYSTAATAGTTLFIDDSDPGVKYAAGWQPALSLEEYFQHTAHICQGAECSLSLDFEGDSVQIFGAVPPGSAAQGFKASVAIDGGTPVPITQPSQPAVTATYNIPLFSSQQLASGSHTIVLTAANGQPLYLDYFLVGSGPASTASDPSPPPASAAPSSTASTATSGVLAPPSGASIPPAGALTPSGPLSPPATALTASLASLEAPSSGLVVTEVSTFTTSPSIPSLPTIIHSASRSPPISAAVGGAVGGIALLAFLLVAVLLWRRRTKKSNHTGHNSFQTSIPQWITHSECAASVASLTTLIVDDANQVQSQATHRKSAELRKERPVSRYLYYDDN